VKVITKKARTGIDANTVGGRARNKPLHKKDRTVKKVKVDEDNWTKEDALDWSVKQNWADHKEEFFLALNADGTYKHHSVATFARDTYPEEDRKRRWMLWSIGSRKVAVIPYQGDWDSERVLDRTKYSLQVRELKEKIESEFDLLGVGKILAESYNPFQERVFNLFKELEVSMGGKVLFDTSTEKDPKMLAKLEAANEHRLKTYLGTLHEIVKLKTSIDNQFLRCLGWDRPQFIAYFDGLRNQEKKDGKEKALDTNITRMLTELAQNQIEKAQMYELELPDDIQNVAERLKEEV